MAMEPEPQPMSHSSSPARGRERRKRHRPDLALGDLAVMLEHVVGQAGASGMILASGARLDLDGDQVQRLDIVEAETVGGR